jgi:hypothetical protein
VKARPASALARALLVVAAAACAGGARAQSSEDRTYAAVSVLPDVGQGGTGAVTRLELATGAPPVRLSDTTRWFHSLGLRRYAFGTTGTALEVERALYDVRYGTSIAQRLGARWSAFAAASVSWRSDAAGGLGWRRELWPSAIAAVAYRPRGHDVFRIGAAVVYTTSDGTDRFLPVPTLFFRTLDRRWRAELGYPTSSILYAPSPKIEAGLAVEIDGGLYRTRRLAAATALGGAYVRTSLVAVAPALAFELAPRLWLGARVGVAWQDHRALDAGLRELTASASGGPTPYAKVGLGVRF